MSQHHAPTTDAPAAQAGAVSLTIDGTVVSVAKGTSIYDAARQLGISIPALCHLPQMGIAAVGVCRACAVDLGGRNFAASCTRACEEGMKVQTASPALEASRKTLVELLLAEHPRPCKRHAETRDCELELLGEKYGLLKPLPRVSIDVSADEKSVLELQASFPKTPLDTLFSPRQAVKPTDTSNLSIAVDHSACILCDRCVRACGDIAGHEVIGRTHKGGLTSIGFGNDKPMGSPDSGCVNCGWCMVACPTGAITYSAGVPPKIHQEQDANAGAPLSLEYMKEVAILKESKISPQFLKRSEGGVVVRQYNKGEIICRQGRYGHTAFYIDSGSVDIYLETSLAALPAKQPSIVSRLKRKLRGGRGDAPDILQSPSRRRTFIPIDANVSLDVNDPIATLRAGDLFGEAACMSAQPRSATARAAENGTIVVIMTRNFLDILRRNPSFRQRFDRQYRSGSLRNHLRDNPLFRDAAVPADYLDSLVERAQLVAFAPGDVIIRQGDEADAFYLVRLGHVMVNKTFEDGSTLTLNYMTRGHFFGEIGLLLNEKRTANCTALDHVELVKITRADFDALRGQFPAVDEAVRKQAMTRKAWDSARFAQSRSMQKTSPQEAGSLDEYLRQSLYEGQSLLVLDLERCTRCDECVRACADAHGGVGRLLRDGLRYDKFLVTTSCRSCRDPLCLTQCPVDAIHREGGLPILIENHCIGCGSCIDNCPYGNIHKIEYEAQVRDAGTRAWKKQTVSKAVVCDLCVDQCLADGEDPSCVYACPHDAAFRVDGPSFFGLPVTPPHEKSTA